MPKIIETKMFADIHKEADAAGKAAADALVPRPMIVGSPSSPLGNNIDPNKPTYFVADGVCGFAWVAFAGNTAWGRWAKKNGIAKARHDGGLSIWISAYNQSMQKKEAYATAYALVLKSHGIPARSDSRMD